MKTKWAVLGSGGIARRRTIPEGIIPAENAQLVAVCGVRSTQDVAKQFGVRGYSTEEELLETDCDVVYVATPVHLHREQVIRAAEAGKHVFCEKPLGLTTQEAEEMLEACRTNKVKLGVGLMMRFQAQHREALRLIQDGRLGKPVFGRAQLSCWYPPIPGAWRQDTSTGGGGSLIDMGSHCIDLLEMFFGRVRRVFCFTANLLHGYRSEDTAAAVLDFENGAKGVVDTLFNVPDESSKNRLELYGSRGSILAEGTIGQAEIGKMVAYVEEMKKDYNAQQVRGIGQGEEISPEPVNMYRAEVEAFSHAIIDDTDPPVSGESGLWNQKILAACYESAATGKAVSL